MPHSACLGRCLHLPHRYMENQYFISSTPDNGAKNGVVEALLVRIRRAIEGGCVQQT